MPSDRIPGGGGRPARGYTLIEAMVAMVVLLTGALAAVGINDMGVRLDGDGRRMTRATAIAEDLVNQIALWQYTDPRLANSVTENDDDIGDTGFVLERTPDSGVAALVDHGEADLTLGGTTWLGIPQAQLQANGFQRYWSVSFNDPGAPGTLLDANQNGVPDGMRIAVIVRWPQGAGWRRIVLLSSKVNPADAQ